MRDDFPAGRLDDASRPAKASTGRQGTGLLTDRYELTMVRAAIGSGAAGRRSVFEMFARRLPTGRRYGIVAGTGRFLAALQRFAFSADEIDYLLAAGVADDATARFLASYRFSGNVWGYGEGDCYFPGSPILVVEGTFAEAVMLETLALSVFNHDCAIASAAARMVSAAGARPIIEMGSRRTHEVAAVAAARAAYLAGFSATSNLRAGLDHGVPTAGTSAHAFTLAHDDEPEAFRAQLESLGTGTTLLVDTYDVADAVAAAVRLAGSGLGAVRIDSGDLAQAAASARAQLDSLGATGTRIIATGDLDEHSIARLATAPVDGYGVGTCLVTGSGAPTAGLVYKLVARSADPGTVPLPVSKRSAGKPTIGGRKWAARAFDDAGTAVAEHISMRSSAPEHLGHPGEAGRRPLLRHLVLDGEIVGTEPIDAARQRREQALRELPASAHLLSPGEPAIPTVFELSLGLKGSEVTPGRR